MLYETFLALGYFHHLKSHKIVKDILPHAGNSEKETFTCSNNWSVRLEKNSCLQRKLQPQGDENVTTFQSKQWNELVLYIATLFTAFSDTLSITSKHFTVNSRKWSTKKKIMLLFGIPDFHFKFRKFFISFSTGCSDLFV